VSRFVLYYMNLSHSNVYNNVKLKTMKITKMYPAGLNWVYGIQNKEGLLLSENEKYFTNKFSQALKFRGVDAIPMAKLYLWFCQKNKWLNGCMVVSLPEVVFV
jgi:hypothetical protein